MKFNTNVFKAIAVVTQSMMIASTVDADGNGKISTEEGKAAAKAEIRVILGAFPELRGNFKDPAKVERVAEKLVDLAGEFIHGSD